MKNVLRVACCVAGLLVSLSGRGEDRAGVSVRYRTGATLSFDSTSKLQDEDGRWALSAGQLGKLAVLQGGTVAMATNFTKTVTFGTAFSAAPTVVASGNTTNALAYVTSVTTTNCVIGAAVTNAAISWVAFGSP